MKGQITMKRALCIAILFTGAGAAFGQATPSGAAAAGTWKPLSDGKTFTGWEQTSPNWRIEAGAFACKEKSMLRTAQKFLNFELELEWRAKSEANGGVFYALADDQQTGGPEMQLCDPKYAGISQPGGLYGILAPTRDATKPLGTWNSARIVVSGRHREHWINNVLVLSYDLDSSAYRTALNEAKNKQVPGLRAPQSGAIGLQSMGHGAEIAYRNIRIRELAAKP